jgi:nucleoside-diphosphate kinase
MEKTLIIVKPDAVTRGYAGKILGRFEDEGFKIRGLRMLHMTKKEAEGFYHVHRERPFFDSLTDFMSSAPVCVAVLEGREAISRVRAIMGATNPIEAAEGTLRRLYASDVEKNSVHGSDSPESAATEIPYFFRDLDLCEYARIAT